MPVPKGYVIDQPQDQPKPPAGYTLDAKQPDAVKKNDQTPWTKYAPLDSSNSSTSTAAPKQGFFSSAADASGLSTIGNALLHPYDTAKAVAGAATYGGGDTENPIINGLKSAVQNTVDHGKQAVDAAKHGNWAGVASHGISAIPIAGPLIDKATDQAADNGMGKPGNSYAQDLGKVVTSPGAMGTLAGGAASVVLPKTFEEGLSAVPRLAKTAVAGDVNKPMPGTDLTPAQRYASAKRLGVDLPAAQATNSPLLRGLDWWNREGLLSAPMHEELAAKNANAITSATDKLTQQMSPVDAETGGKIVQKDLKQPFLDLQNEANDKLSEMSALTPEQGGARVQSLAKSQMDAQHTASTEGYQQFSADHGDTPISNLKTVTDTADDIAKKNAPLLLQFPSLVSRKVGGVVGDAAQLGDKTPTVGNLIRSRSALLDMTRDPEIIKSANMADIQRLIAAHDQAITDSLPEAGQKTWRDLNDKYAAIKDTFDNSSNPMYHAIRTPTPSTLADGVGGPTPEAVKSLRKVTGDEGVGIVQRGVTEKMLGRTEDGQYDLGNFSTKLQRAPEGFRQELYGNDMHEDLQQMAARYRDIEPFAKAAYTDNPEALTKGVGPKTAEGVRQMFEMPVKPEGAYGPPAPRISPEGQGAIRRGVAEDMLGTTRENGYNFKTFPGKLARMNEGYRSELFGPEQSATLKDLADTSTALDTDYNRSGSGKLGQKVFEAGALFSGHPYLMLEPAMQYPVGKFMTSPKMADWLMKPATKAGSRPWLRPPLPLLAAPRKKQ